MLKITGINFKGAPNNYHVIDKTLSRSAQPKKDEFLWLRDNGVTDIINFRTMYNPSIEFDEKSVVEEAGMRYHSIPSITAFPTESNIWKFLDIINKVQKENGKVHIHCKAGADRTGMYSLIYKQINKIGDFASNKAEMLKFGHNKNLYPDLMCRIENFLKIYGFK